MPDGFQKRDGARDREDGDPGAFSEFCDNYNDESDGCRRGTDCVYPEMRLMRGAPAFGFLLADHPPPVNRHSSLRQREGEECTYGKERNEMVGDAIENEQQRAGAGGKIKNTD